LHDTIVNQCVFIHLNLSLCVMLGCHLTGIVSTFDVWWDESFYVLSCSHFIFAAQWQISDYGCLSIALYMAIIIFENKWLALSVSLAVIAHSFNCSHSWWHNSRKWQM